MADISQKTAFGTIGRFGGKGHFPGLGDNRENLLENGFNDLLEKPVSFTHLAAILRKWLPLHPCENVPFSKNQPPSLSAWDSLAFIHRCGGDPSLARSVLRSLLGDFTLRIHQLQNAVNREDFGAIQRQVQTLSASVITLQLNPLQPLLQALEKSANLNDALMVQTDLATFSSAFDAMREDLDDFSKECMLT